jgi:hypothetical protein
MKTKGSVSKRQSKAEQLPPVLSSLLHSHSIALLLAAGIRGGLLTYAAVWPRESCMALAHTLHTFTTATARQQRAKPHM